MIVVYTEEQNRELERLVMFFAQSNQWLNYIGYVEKVRKIDRFINCNEMTNALVLLMKTTHLPQHPAVVAVYARQSYLKGR